MINPATERVILRWIHLIVAIPIVGYIYSPFKNLPDYAPLTRYLFFPIMVLTGLWMWKGYWVRRLFTKRSSNASA
jgi:thiosulfate reductase cytochrome b subunit